MDVAFVYVGRKHIFVFAAQDFIGKLPPYLVRLFRRGLSRREGLYQMVGEVVAFLHGLFQLHVKFNIRCFKGAAEGGHKQLFIRLCRVFDVVKGFLYGAFDRFNLCNRHISASAPFMSSMSCAYTVPVAFIRFAI